MPAGGVPGDAHFDVSLNPFGLEYAVSRVLGFISPKSRGHGEWDDLQWRIDESRDILVLTYAERVLEVSRQLVLDTNTGRRRALARLLVDELERPGPIGYVTSGRPFAP